MDPGVADYVDELVRYVSGAGTSLHGIEPVPMEPIAYVSGALGALQRTGRITHEELDAELRRCHDAYGLKPPPAPADAPHPGGLRAVGYKPEWADSPPPEHRRP